MFKKDTAVKPVTPTAVEKESTTDVGEQVQEATSDFGDSAVKLEELRAGRGESDIPLNDAYWEYRNSHTLTHGKHAVRVDETQLIKGKPVDKSKLAE